MLKRWQGVRAACCTTQPPSGGCVLKPKSQTQSLNYFGPAAFRRLCVETVLALDGKPKLTQPPSGGCVLKHFVRLLPSPCRASRLQAAVC